MHWMRIKRVIFKLFSLAVLFSSVHLPGGRKKAKIFFAISCHYQIVRQRFIYQVLHTLIILNKTRYSVLALSNSLMLTLILWAIMFIWFCLLHDCLHFTNSRNVLQFKENNILERNENLSYREMSWIVLVEGDVILFEPAVIFSLQGRPGNPGEKGSQGDPGAPVRNTSFSLLNTRPAVLNREKMNDNNNFKKNIEIA